MKKMLLTLMILAPLLAGCANVNTEITINDNKSAQVVTELTYKGKLNDAADNTAQTIMKNYENFLDDGYKVETVFDKEQSGIKATKKVKNLSNQDLDLSSLGFSSNLESGRFIEIKKNFLISSYNIDLTYDYKNNISKITPIEDKSETPESKTLQPEYYQKYGDMDEMEAPQDREDSIEANLDEDTKQFTNEAIEEINNETAQEPQKPEMEISIRVPSFASYNNADSAFEGNVYTWKVKENGPTEIKLQYVRYSGFAIAFIILLGISLLVYMTKKILKHETQKRMDNVDNIV